MKEIRFGYGLAINTFVCVLSIILFLVAMALPLMWYWYDNQLYLLLPLGIFIFFLLTNYVLSKRDFLIINNEGITLNYLLRKREVISWDTIKKVEHIKEWKKKEGWEIIYKKDVSRDGNFKKETCTLFIPDAQVAASNETVTNALKRGFQEFRCHGIQYHDSFENNAKSDKQLFGFFILSIIWVVLNILYFYLDHLWTPSNLEAIMRCTLVGGERYDTDPNLILIEIWMILCFFSEA